MIQRRKRSNNTCSCIKTTPKSTKKNKKTVIISLKPVRKARTKIKKPRFLSLSNTQMRLASDYPKNVVVKDHHHHNHESNENMADIFAYDDGGLTPTTLTGLLNAAVSSSSYEVARENNGTTEGSVISSLVRTALRNRERDASEEKWVSIRDVSPAATCEEEVTSGWPVMAEGGGGDGGGGGGDCGGLCLKLDYEEVLNAWSGKGPFCVEAETESLQTVPDLHFDNFINHGGSCSSARNNGQWSVPEDDLKGHIDHTTEIGDTFFGINGWKLGLREASVLRYKAKRQSRLFSKRIRYEVRKLNAEKRPRIKGRFVRRRVDEEKCLS